MAAVTWGQLAKSLIDPKLIEERIAEMIAEHNEDETAHLGAGQSLQSHKTSEIIDHLIASIVADKLARFSVKIEKLVSDQIFHISSFESLDGWLFDGAPIGEIYQNFGGVKIKTAAGVDSWVVLTFQGIDDGKVINFNKKVVFQTTIVLTNAEGFIAYITAGNKGVDDYFGFLINDGELFAVSARGLNVKSTKIADLTGEETLLFRAEHDPDKQQDLFFVNEELKATHTECLPSGGSQSGSTYYLQNLYSYRRYFYILNMVLSTYPPVIT